MQYLTFGKEEKATYQLCILVNRLSKTEIEDAYIKPFGLDPEEVLAIKLHQTHDGQGRGKKTTAKERKRWINEELTEALNGVSVQYLLIADGEYFKTICNKQKVDAYAGYVLNSDFGPWKCVSIPTFEAIFYDPERVRGRIATALRAVREHATGTYSEPGHGILELAEYPMSVSDIEGWLDALLKENRPLTCDIEGFGLKHYTSGLGSICFSWNEREGIAFPIDILGDEYHSREVRQLLVRFFEQFQNKLIFHKIDFDVTVLIYQLFMKNIIDNKGLLYGLKVMLKNWDCTRIISYLATNSCAGNKLGLKDQSQEYTGNYAVDEIKDIRKIELPKLLEYNLIDGVATWYVYNKNYPIMIKDDQLDIYQNIFKPAMVDIIQMQLTGLPINMERVKIAKAELQKDSDAAVAKMMANPLVQKYSYQRLENYVQKKNETWVKKRATLAEIEELAKTNEAVRKETTFNPNSGPQLIEILYGMCGLPVIEKTDSGEPATDAKTLKSLKNHTEHQEVLEFLEAVGAYASVNKILTSTIPAFEGAQLAPDGWHYLFGNFNLGGTLSGRLSASDPNLQNLPASSKYAKLIKWCVCAPPGWFFCGIDFASLEDRISALTTKDPNKLKVYTDGWDGHAMRAVVYFADQMPDIDPNNKDQVNAMSRSDHKYKPLRDKSKNPTFALTYQGTYKTLMSNYGFSLKLALQCETAYQTLYEVSVKWVNQKLDQAMVDGYVTCAFGLRVRTPLLAQVVRGTKKTPHEAEAEGRSAGNALGQSWCLLNSRAGSEFMGKVRESEYRHDIRPCAQIHDAQYYMVKDNIDTIMYCNEHVVKAVKWQDHPDIWHDEVKLGGEFSVFYPDWSKEMSLPNNASETDIYKCLEKHLEKLQK